MFAGDEKGPAVVDVTQKVARTKIAVFDPQITRLHRLEQGAEQGAFLRMAIFTGKNIGDQALGGLIDHQGFAGQGPPLSLAQLLDAVLKAELIPVLAPVAVGEPARRSASSASTSRQSFGDRLDSIASTRARSASFNSARAARS